MDKKLHVKGLMVILFSRNQEVKSGNKVKRIPHFLRQEARLSLNR